MSREICINCKAILATTHNPNSIEGYWISDEMLEAFNGEWDNRSWPLKEFSRYASRAVHCSVCSTIYLN
jgi:hypothetical protein